MSVLLRSATVVGLFVALAGCNEKYRMIATTCETVKHYFTLNNADYVKCLNDENYRQNLVSSRDEQWSQQLSNAHNRNARIMLPKKSQGQYVRISQVTDLPLKGIVNLSGEEAQRHIGEHYVIAGTLQSGESDKDSFMLYADADPDRQHYVFVASDLLDSYQKAFIKDYCFLDGPGERSSMCHGDVYLSVQREPDGFFISNEMDGAALTPSNAAAVLGILDTLR